MTKSVPPLPPGEGLGVRVRVAHVTQGLDVGGQERLLVEMARHRNRERFDWTVIVLGTRGPLADSLEAERVRVMTLDAPTGLRFSLWRRLMGLLRAEPFDVVHTHDDRPLIYGMPAAWWAGVRRRIHTHHHGRLAQFTRRQRFVMRQAARFAHQFVCVSNDSARYMIDQGVSGAKVQTIWNGIDLGRFAYQGPTDDGPIVTVARLSPEKDIASLLNAIPLVGAAFPNAHFEIAGDGPLRGDLEKQIKALNIAGRVILHGEVRDIPALLARARLFVLPSLSEGVSLTLLEAMARGLPIVTTQVGGNPEVVEANGTGMLVPPDNAGALADAIKSVLNDPARGRALGVAGRRRVENCFDIRKMTAQYEALYNQSPLTPNPSPPTGRGEEGQCTS